MKWSSCRALLPLASLAALVLACSLEGCESAPAVCDTVLAGQCGSACDVDTACPSGQFCGIDGR